MISYCIASYRPEYSKRLVSDLINKMSVPFEILIWLNVHDPGYEKFLGKMKAKGGPIKIIGKTPDNIGMAAYLQLFQKSQYEIIVQIDDDVICISRQIAQRAMEIFNQFKRVKQLTADVWQDEYTTGARPPLSAYKLFNRQHGLYMGPIDGWFSLYHRSILPLILKMPVTRYFPLGSVVKNRLKKQGLYGLLCTAFKVFHVIGPIYTNYFGMLEFEIQKYKELGRHDIVEWYQKEKENLPAPEQVSVLIDRIIKHLDLFS